MSIFSRKFCIENSRGLGKIIFEGFDPLSFIFIESVVSHKKRGSNSSKSCF